MQFYFYFDSERLFFDSIFVLELIRVFYFLSVSDAAAAATATTSPSKQPKTIFGKLDLGPKKLRQKKKLEGQSDIEMRAPSTA